MSPTHSLSYSDSNNEIKLQIIDYDQFACVATDCGGASGRSTVRPERGLE